MEPQRRTRLAGVYRLVNLSCGALEWSCLLAAVGLLLFIVGVTGADVLLRSVADTSIVWSGEASVVALVWLVFLAGAAAYRRGMFPAFVTVLNRLDGRLRRAAVAVVYLVNLVAFGMLAVYGVEFAMANMVRQSPVLGMSLGVNYLAIPVGGALLSLFTLEAGLGELAEANGAPRSRRYRPNRFQESAS